MPDSNEQSHPDWHQADNFLVGYGSLLSADSRLRFSNNPHLAISVSVKGYQRSWITRAHHEQQTYVGALPNDAAEINAHCVPITLNPSLQKREQDYRFVELAHRQVEPNGCQNTQLWAHVTQPNAKLWICESLKRDPATPDFPINLSYIDTCLSGCIQHYQGLSARYNIEQGISEAKRFIETTSDWQSIVNDRHVPRYPRAAVLTKREESLIDELLKDIWITA